MIRNDTIGHRINIVMTGSPHRDEHKAMSDIATKNMMAWKFEKFVICSVSNYKLLQVLSEDRIEIR